MGVLIFVLFLWTTTLGALQTTEVFYGTYMATEVAYYTYIYAKVDREHFQVVTGYTKSAILAGRFLAGVVAQFMVSFRIMDLRELNYLSLGCTYTEWLRVLHKTVKPVICPSCCSTNHLTFLGHCIASGWHQFVLPCKCTRHAQLRPGGKYNVCSGRLGSGEQYENATVPAEWQDENDNCTDGYNAIDDTEAANETRSRPQGCASAVAALLRIVFGSGDCAVESVVGVGHVRFHASPNVHTVSVANDKS